MIKALIRPLIPEFLLIKIRRFRREIREYFFSIERKRDLDQLQAFEHFLNKNDQSLKQFTSILDFGCGHGRLIRYLFELLPEAELSGCEIYPHLIEECISNYPRGNFILNETSPPLPFKEDQFDFIYSYSVFTNISCEDHLAWVNELSRVLKPGGLLLQTIHGYECLKRLAMFSPESLAKYQLGIPVDEFLQSSKGYHFAQCDSMEYYTIISKEYIMEHWPSVSGLKVLDYEKGAIEAYPEGCQDLVLLIK